MNTSPTAGPGPIGTVSTATVNAVVERLEVLSGDETDPWKRNTLNVLGHRVMLVNITLGEALKKKMMGSRNIISFA